MPRKFKPGDWVKVKGKLTTPKMQVLKYIPKKSLMFGLVDNESYIKCIWYKSGERKSKIFHQNNLIKITETGGLFKTFNSESKVKCNSKYKITKRYLTLFIISLLSLNCIGQGNQSKNDKKEDSNAVTTIKPKGTWEVKKEFDKNGNLIRYDSIYSWSSNNKFDNLSLSDKDSLMQSFKSRFFSNFSAFESQGFEDIFSQDSLFIKRFFNDDFFGSNFGSDFMDIDKLRQEMIKKQKEFLEKYQSEFIKPEDEN